MTGAAGQVGKALRTVCPDAIFLSRRDLDVRHAQSVARAMQDVQTVVHLAAMTDVDLCETKPEQAASVNIQGTKNVVDAANQVGARVIHLSTDYVFDGLSSSEYLENQRPSPINTYGRTKLEGERYVLTDPGHLVVRTSWVIGDGTNFVRSILSAARAMRVVKVVEDQVGRPTFAADLALALRALINSEVAGIVHVCGDGPPCSWADLAELVIEQANLDSSVVRIDSATYAKLQDRIVASRPVNSTLSLGKAKRMNIPLGVWRSSLIEYMSSMQ